MNFLAHIHLSGSDAALMTGNYLGDFVRKKKLVLSDDSEKNEKVLKGMSLHRCIDRYTDGHPLVKQVQKYFIPEFGKYASVLSDLYFDYLLCNYWSSFSKVPLKEFTDRTMLSLDQHKDFFNVHATQFYGYMHRNDILMNYGRKEIMEMVLMGISNRRLKGKLNLANSMHTFERHEEEITDYFIKFYPDLINRGKDFIEHSGMDSDIIYGQIVRPFP